MTNNDKEALRKLLLPGDVEDFKTGTVLRLDNGEERMFKFCPRCKKLRPIEDFAPSGHTKDGISVKCEDCLEALKAARNAKSQDPATSEDEIIEPMIEEVHTPVISVAELGVEDLVDKLLSKFNEEKKKNDNLSQQLRKLEREQIDLNRLSELQIRTVLSSDRVQPNLLFGALKTKTSEQYTFYYKDNVLGELRPIKAEAI